MSRRFFLQSFTVKVKALGVPQYQVVAVLTIDGKATGTWQYLSRDCDVNFLGAQVTERTKRQFVFSSPKTTGE
jgi:hypothetical protein